MQYVELMLLMNPRLALMNLFQIGKMFVVLLSTQVLEQTFTWTSKPGGLMLVAHNVCLCVCGIHFFLVRY